MKMITRANYYSLSMAWTGSKIQSQGWIRSWPWPLAWSEFYVCSASWEGDWCSSIFVALM